MTVTEESFSAFVEKRREPLGVVADERGIDVPRAEAWMQQHEVGIAHPLGQLAPKPAARDLQVLREGCEEFIAAAFAAVGLDWHDHTQTDPSLMRAADITESHADPSLAKALLGWQAKTRMSELVGILVEEEMQRLSAA
mgnify:CR=1 FL=1